MSDGPLMLWLNWPVVVTIHPLSNNFATGELKLNDSPGPDPRCIRTINWDFAKADRYKNAKESRLFPPLSYLLVCTLLLFFYR